MPQDDIFCIWEASQPLSAEEFQSFIDGPDGPAPGVFINRVFPVIEGGITPSTAFPASGLNAIMAKIEACPPMPHPPHTSQERAPFGAAPLTRLLYGVA